MSDVISATRQQEKMCSKSAKSVQHLHPLLMPYTHADRLRDYNSMQLSVQFDPAPDGNCQFSAMADQLASLGIFRSAATLRDEIVQNLRSNPFTINGTPLSHYVDGNDWDAYLDSMSPCGTYGDHITLQRAAEIFNVQFLIISTLGTDASSVISESNTYSESLPLLVLGHIAEGHGEHYLSLEGPVSSFIENIVEAERERYGCESNQEDAEPDGSLNECHDATFDENHHHFLDENDCTLDEPHHNPLDKPHVDALFEASDTLNECHDASFNVNHHHMLNKPDYCTLDQHHHDPLDIPHDDARPYDDGNSEMPNLPTELL